MGGLEAETAAEALVRSLARLATSNLVSWKYMMQNEGISLRYKLRKIVQNFEYLAKE